MHAVELFLFFLLFSLALRCPLHRPPAGLSFAFPPHLSVVLFASIPTRPFTNVSLAGSFHSRSFPNSFSFFSFQFSISTRSLDSITPRGAAFYDPA